MLGLTGGSLQVSKLVVSGRNGLETRAEGPGKGNSQEGGGGHGGGGGDTQDLRK